MKNFNQAIQNLEHFLKDIRREDAEYILLGSAVLAAFGLRDIQDDLDVYVPSLDLDSLLAQGIINVGPQIGSRYTRAPQTCDKIPITFYDEDRMAHLFGQANLGRIINSTIPISKRVRVLHPRHLLAQKCYGMRPKDIPDIALLLSIPNWLNTTTLPTAAESKTLPLDPSDWV